MEAVTDLGSGAKLDISAEDVDKLALAFVAEGGTKDDRGHDSSLGTTTGD